MKARRIPAYLFSFRGRINRLQWWMGELIIVLPAAVVADDLTEKLFDDIATCLQIISVCIALVLLCWLDLALSAKRYHDMGKSGWRQWISIIPVIGRIWVLIELGFFRGEDRPNKYGYPGVFGQEAIYSRGTAVEQEVVVEPPL